MERVWLNRRWLLEGWDGGPARRMSEGQAEARWEALASGFGWAIQLAARRAVGLAEAMRVEEETRDGGVAEGDMAAVDEVLERRRVGSGYEALVAWAGQDPMTGKAWPNSWVPEAWLSADLRRKRVRLPVKRESAEERRRRVAEERQLEARRRGVEEARRRGAMAERDLRAHSRGARRQGASHAVGPRARVRKWGRQEVGWQRWPRGLSTEEPAGKEWRGGGVSKGDIPKAARDGGGGGGYVGAAEVAGGDIRRRSRRLFNGDRVGRRAARFDGEPALR